MIQYYKSILTVEASWLISSGLMTASSYAKHAQRGNIRIARRGGYMQPALVDYESLPQRYKDMIQEKIGNPYHCPNDNILTNHLVPSAEAADYYENYKVDDGRHLPSKTVRQYHAEASILDAISTIVALRKGKRSALGHITNSTAGKMKEWERLADMVALLNVDRWPHHLPTNARALERKWKAYKKDGYEALIHGQWKNGQRNATALKTEQERNLLLQLVSDPRNLYDTQVAQLYNAQRAEGSRPITDRIVATFRRTHEQDIYARRHGATDFRNRRLMTVKRSAPSAPLYLWTLDGWDAELLYQKTANKGTKTLTTYHNRVKLEVVLDACTRYPIGYAIGDVENPELIRSALRNAINHTAELFGRRFKPAQIQMDHAGYKSLKEFYAMTAIHVTPAAVRNAKAKVIEPWFRQFNDRYCHLQTNWSGYGLTANKENQPNVEYINKYRHSFPDRDGVVAQLVSFIEMERQRLRHDYLKKWESMPQENRFPMSDEQYLMAYGVKTTNTYLLRNTGIKITLPGTGGRTVEYDSFDHHMRQHASVRWSVLYDPDDTSKAIAVNDDGSLRFLLEEKYIQPMALIERKEGDRAQLDKVLQYNRREEQRIADRFAAIEATQLPQIDTSLDTNAGLIAHRDYETLSKLCIVDSDGQHKRQKDIARTVSDDAYDAYDKEKVARDILDIV